MVCAEVRQAIAHFSRRQALLSENFLPEILSKVNRQQIFRAAKDLFVFRSLKNTSMRPEEINSEIRRKGLDLHAVFLR